MALIKVVELASGIIVDYHKIDSINIVHDFKRNTKTFKVELSRYKNNTARFEGKNKVDSVTFDLDCDFNYSHLELRGEIYNKLKLLTYFSGAISDILG